MTKKKVKIAPWRRICAAPWMKEIVKSMKAQEIMND